MRRLNVQQVVAEARPISPRGARWSGLAAAAASRLSDYLELAKPRIVVLGLFVAAAAACLAAPHALEAGVVLQALAATALVAGSASAANQWLERRVDAHMRRTANRPLPAGRIAGREAIILSAIGVVGGTIWLALAVNRVAAALGLISWAIYVVAYTPLKSRSPLNTTVGAVAGAIPALMGWTATGAPLDLTAWSLAGVLFLWQFPHFMAIAWLYRSDYATAGHRMLSVVDPTGVRCGLQAAVGALALIPVSLIPAMAPMSGSPIVHGLWAVLLGAAQLAFAIQFAVRRDETSARRLLRMTLVYLPAWLAVMLMVTM
jgi:protoheme IX farnesyltransferase